MQLPRIRAIRLNTAIHDFATSRVDASIGLTKFGLFSLTLGALTSGSSTDGTLELLDLARKIGIKPENKESWENFQLGVCGLTSGDFRTCFDEVKQKLRDADFPLETIRMVFNHAIIGLPKSEELMLPIRERLKDSLFDVVLGVENDKALQSRMYEFMLFEREDEVWEVYSAISDELQRERVMKQKTSRRRAQLKREFERVNDPVGQNTLRGEPDKEMSPSHPTKAFCKKRCREEESLNPAKSAKVPQSHGPCAGLTCLGMKCKSGSGEVKRKYGG
ncbi:hypothetical protein PC128_g1461 [Phytophthora cactorum]|nr:hypothetical protein PC120_g6471 [Phytophthora cactorum]KAG3102998.1 hypothetical protein PC121_g1086 [Phytophthora cactorum]KAG3205316.1 hypothetical protein PC128_g1461 [Phytophthora cactorum]KAG4058576.1 hypothetical protein PC123_g6466 [Phytophthora cactorum]